MTRAVLLALWSALALAAGSPAAAERSAAAPDRVVGRWLDVTLETIASERTNPPRSSRVLALVSVAMAEAASGSPAEPAAVAGAASTILAHLFPGEARRFHQLASRERSQRGFARGRVIGLHLVERARHDGSDAQWSGSVPGDSGLWVPTPPAFAAPLEPLAGAWRPWNLARGSSLRPPPPPRPGSPRFDAELREVYEISRSLTAEQRRIAERWADGPGTVTPPGHWNLIALELIRSRSFPTVRAARVLAVLNTAQADAFIACWDAKFAYWSERPVTAIRRELDPGWQPFVGTPPFPAYTSGHATTSAAAAEVLAAFFPAAAKRLRAQAAEAAMSRLYGGIHFRVDNEAGARLGRAIGRRALERWAGKVAPWPPSRGRTASPRSAS